VPFDLPQLELKLALEAAWRRKGGEKEREVLDDNEDGEDGGLHLRSVQFQSASWGSDSFQWLVGPIGLLSDEELLSSIVSNCVLTFGIYRCYAWDTSGLRAYQALRRSSGLIQRLMDLDASRPVHQTVSDTAATINCTIGVTRCSHLNSREINEKIQTFWSAILHSGEDPLVNTSDTVINRVSGHGSQISWQVG